MGATTIPATGGGGITWTAISSPSISGTTGVTFSSLGGYKYYRLMFANLGLNSDSQIYIDINSSGANNRTIGEAGTSSTSSGSNSFSSSVIGLGGSLSLGYGIVGSVDFPQADLTGHKSCQINTGWITWSGTVAQYFVGNGSADTTAPITSIGLSANVNFLVNGVTLYGGN